MVGLLIDKLWHYQFAFFSAGFLVFGAYNDDKTLITNQDNEILIIRMTIEIFLAKFIQVGPRL